MTKKKDTDMGFEQPKAPKLSTTAMNLETNQTKLNFFAAAESLKEGESCLYIPKILGPESKKRCLGMKAWMTWERKRRIKVMSIGAGESLTGIDPLAGTSMYLEKTPEGNYNLKIEKPEEEQILVHKKDGSILSSL